MKANAQTANHEERISRLEREVFPPRDAATVVDELAEAKDEVRTLTDELGETAPETVEARDAVAALEKELADLGGPPATEEAPKNRSARKRPAKRGKAKGRK